MHRTAAALALSLPLSFLAGPAAAGTITEVRVTPNPAVIRAANEPAQVNVEVHVNPGSIITQPCEAIITPGDGTNVPRMVFGVNTKATQIARLRYTKPGTYKVSVAGFGSNGCSGTRTISLTVNAAAAPATGGAAGAAPAATATAAAMPACPAGWSPAANAVSGAKLACRADAVPLSCPQGTTYFSQPGVIGCR